MNKKRLVTAIFSYFGRRSTRARQRLAAILAWLGLKLLRSRVHIVKTNLALAFPELSDEQRHHLLHRHFQLLAQSIIDRGVLWFGTREKILELVSITGLEHLQSLLNKKQPIILLAPHFIGLDAAATRLTLFLEESATMYTSQSDTAIDTIVRQGRGRFNQVHLVNRKEGIRGLLRYLREGIPVYYLPDMDFGRRGATFVPFFGVPAATLTATAQIARKWSAAVVPIVTTLNDTTGIYDVKVLPPLENFPGAQNDEAATARLSHDIETWVKPDPAQYYWVHRRYKTRPNPDDPKLY